MWHGNAYVTVTRPRVGGEYGELLRELEARYAPLDPREWSGRLYPPDEPASPASYAAPRYRSYASRKRS